MKKLSFEDFKILFLAREISFETERLKDDYIEVDEYIATIKDISKDINSCNSMVGIMNYLGERGHNTIDAYEFILGMFIEMEHKNYK